MAYSKYVDEYVRSIFKESEITVRYSVCSLCGRQLLTPGPYLIRKDERDKYHDFHSIRWSICDICDKELQDRAEQVKKDLAYEAELDRNGESPVIEF